MSDVNATDVNTTATAQPTETELAQEWKQDCLKDARAIQHRNLAIMASLILLAVILIGFGIRDWAVIALGGAVIPFLVYLDARGREKEVQERPGLKLVPGFNRVFGPDGRRRSGGATESKPANAS